jgi:formylglycine-generating enzyme required for sulfatase activity
LLTDEKNFNGLIDMKYLSVRKNKASKLLLLSVFVLFNSACAPSNQKVESSGVNTPQQTNNSMTQRQYTLSSASQKQLLSEMLLVEGGTFDMGSNDLTARKRETPVHQVTLDSFYMGKTEVTQALFKELMGWNNSYFACETCPINNVSWFNIQLFLERLNKITGKNYRLPTEAEWAYAAKGGNKSKGFRYSGSDNIADVAWYADNANRKSHPVAMKKPNELGLYDMTGNLWEFCQDDMSRRAYTNQPRNNPLVLKTDNIKQKSMKVIRGSGYEFTPNESEVYRRDGATNNVRMPDIGFRLVLDKK